jgi:sugar (pentulose or hexulose) kinase
VTFLPHLSTGGERAPFVDGAMRGALLGLSFASTRADIARAGYEGMAYVMAECFDRLPPVQGIVLGGGASRSRLLGQILADVTGVPIALPGVGEPGVLGAARLAGLAIGVEIPRAGLARLYQPLPAATELYSERRERVARSRQAVRDISTPRTKD